MEITEREFTKEEFYRFLPDVPEEETDYLINYCRQVGLFPWDFFQQFQIGSYGLWFNNRPTYYVCLFDLGDDMRQLWTLRNKNIPWQFSFYKICKKRVIERLIPHAPVYTMNFINNKKEARWNMRMGFIPYKIEGDMVYFRFDNHKGGT